jgi:hypothetical protein
MTKTDPMIRGYDDTPFLRQMARGLVLRTYASVDEAAKAVLDEPGGSNVDRLRRKFREQGWYETGLREYVEEQAGTIVVNDAVPTEPDRPVGDGEALSMGRFRSMMDRMVLANAPTGAVLFSLTAVLFMGVAAHFGILSNVVSLGVFAGFTLLMASFWLEKTARTVPTMVAVLHCAALVALAIWSAVFFRAVEPNSVFVLGSTMGALSSGIIMVVLGGYLASIVIYRTDYKGWKKDRMTFALTCLLLTVFSLPLAMSNVEFYSVSKQAEESMATWVKLSSALYDIEKDQPGANVDALKEIQQKLVVDWLIGHEPAAKR